MDPFDAPDSLKPVPDYPMTLTPPKGRIVISAGGKTEVVDLNEGDQIKVEKDGTYQIIRFSEKKP